MSNRPLLRRLIINADDYGLTDGVCRAIHELFDADAISSTTLMLAADGAIERCRKWNIAKLVGHVGVHLQLTGGCPLLPREQVPSLLDGNSERFRSKETLPLVDSDDVEREWRAQIEMAYKLLGKAPSHLDSHHGVHHVPALAGVFAKLALEYGVPVRDRSAIPLKSRSILLGSDVVIYGWTGQGKNIATLKSTITKAMRASTTQEVLELVSHPGHSDPELETVSSLNKLRERDFEVLLELARGHWLNQQHISLVDFSSIGQKTSGRGKLHG